MLKLIENEVPTWDIDGVNKEYVLDEYIGYISNIIVDWSDIWTAYTFEHDTITTTVAPVTSITVSSFTREERDILGNGEVTLWDLIDEVWEEIWRTSASKIYPKPKIRRELNQTIWTMLDWVPERGNIQYYSLKWLNWLTVEKDQNTVSITTAESYPLAIEWSFLVWKWIYYNYYDYDWIKFEVAGNDLIDDFDKINVWHRIPYWVERVSEVYVDWYKLEYIDSRDFYMDTINRFTIIKDYQGNEYLYLPYSSAEYTLVVKYVPDYAIMTKDEDILNLPYRYKRVPVYDVVYRLLASREDNRWQYYEKAFEKEYRKYKAYKAKWTRKTKSKIWFASTFDRGLEYRTIEIIPEWFYDDL